MAATVFPRQSKLTVPVSLTGSKIYFAIGHVLIGYCIYWMLQNNIGGRLVQQVLKLFGKSQSEAEQYVTPVTADRLSFLVLFASIYGLRWGLLGAFTTNGGNSMPWTASIQVVLYHYLQPVLAMTIVATLGGGVPSDLDQWDYVALALSVLAGLMQHGSELQRLLFKMDPSNKGKLHTTGLFGYARFINHTGHVLHDFALAIVVRSYFLGVAPLLGVLMIFFHITPETEAHMQTKYKEKYAAYCDRTPYKFIPYVW